MTIEIEAITHRIERFRNYGRQLVISVRVEGTWWEVYRGGVDIYPQPICAEHIVLDKLDREMERRQSVADRAPTLADIRARRAEEAAAG